MRKCNVKLYYRDIMPRKSKKKNKEDFLPLLSKKKGEYVPSLFKKLHPSDSRLLQKLKCKLIKKF